MIKITDPCITDQDHLHRAASVTSPVPLPM